MNKRKTKKGRTSTKPRASKADWLSTALDMLATDGIDGVRVERIARALGISKSGFYWHFKNRADLCAQMLAYWAHEFTEVISQNPEIQKIGPEERLLQLMRIVLDHDLTRYELSMLAWADRDPEVAVKVHQVYRRRSRFIRSALAELGFEGQELEMRTRLFLCYHTWEGPMFSREPKAKLRRLQQRRLAMLTSGA